MVQIHRDTALSLVEIRVLVRQLSYTIKTQLKAPKVPYFGHFLPFAVSLWYKDIHIIYYIYYKAPKRLYDTRSLSATCSESLTQSAPLWSKAKTGWFCQHFLSGRWATLARSRQDNSFSSSRVEKTLH